MSYQHDELFALGQNLHMVLHRAFGWYGIRQIERIEGRVYDSAREECIIGGLRVYLRGTGWCTIPMRHQNIVADIFMWEAIES